MKSTGAIRWSVFSDSTNHHPRIFKRLFNATTSTNVRELRRLAKAKMRSEARAAAQAALLIDESDRFRRMLSETERDPRHAVKSMDQTLESVHPLKEWPSYVVF